MMKLGFVSAILPECSLEEVAQTAKQAGYDCVELMCWPVGKSERRYAGVTHVDVTNFKKSDAARVNDIMAAAGVTISGLGYYPNPLCADLAESKAYIDHIKKVIDASALLGVGIMNTFIGRDQTKTIDENWPRFLKTWKPVIERAEGKGVKVCIENCPMSFSRDEWPGGKNLAVSPRVWRRMFEDIPNANFGLNYDPSHLVWQKMDYIKPLRDFASRMFHVHAKDARLDQERLDDVGLLAYPAEYHTPKLPGLGEINWGRFMSVLSSTGYQGAVCVEVEDRAYEGSLDNRKAALYQSCRYLRQFMA